MEKKKLELRAQAVEDEFKNKEDAAEAGADPDMLGYTEGQAMPGQKFDNKTRMSVRNLRYVCVTFALALSFCELVCVCVCVQVFGE